MGARRTLPTAGGLLLALAGCFSPVSEFPPDSSDAPCADCCVRDSRTQRPEAVANGGVDVWEVWPPSAPTGGFLWVTGAGFRLADRFELRQSGAPAVPLTPVTLSPGETTVRIPAQLEPGTFHLAVLREGQPIGCQPTVSVFAGRALFVAPDGDDAASGEEAAPWKSVATALTRVQPGDFVYLRSGTYEGEFDITASGEPGRPIGLVGYPDDQPLLTTPLTARGCMNATLNVTGSDVLVDHLNVGSERRHCLRAVHVRGRWFFESNDTRRVTVSNCDLSGAMSAGLLVAAEDSRVHRNRLHDNGREGWGGVGLSLLGRGVHVTSNEVYTNLVGGIRVANLEGDAVRPPNTLEGNLIWSNGLGGTTTDGSLSGYGIAVGQAIHPTVVRGNVSCANASLGYASVAADDAVFDGNVSCFNPVGFSVVKPAERVSLAHNVSFEDGISREAVSGMVSEGNTWYRADGKVWFRFEADLIRLADLRRRTGQDLASPVADPMFAAGPREHFDPEALPGWDFCSATTPLLCRRLGSQP